MVELNRAVAVSMAEGPAAGLAIIDRIAGDKQLRNYHWLPSVRADLLAISPYKTAGDMLTRRGFTPEARA